MQMVTGDGIMPEYGLSDKSPEELRDEQRKKELLESIKRGREAERAAIQRGIDAENSSIQTAEILRHMTNQMQEIRDTQEAEQQARIDAEKRAEIASQKQIRENRIWQIIGVTIGLLTLGATILLGILGLLR